MRKCVHAAGYTLVELLVVIAIIGILVSISVPAVTGVRARMRQAQCNENLRQLAIAANNYELSKGTLPGHCQAYGVFDGGIDPADPGSFGGAVPRHMKLGSWHVALLGELDNQPIYERWTQDRIRCCPMGLGNARRHGEVTALSQRLTLGCLPARVPQAESRIRVSIVMLPTRACTRTFRSPTLEVAASLRR
ncbi:MAG: DUF1559 domain-containing protein [Rubripirellula sp.]